MATKPNQPEAQKQEEPKVEVGKDLAGEQDFFHCPHKDPNYHYHWVENNPRKVQKLKREGYEIDPAASASAANETVQHQRDFLKRRLSALDVKPEEARAAKELLDRLEASNVDTTINIPHHVMMRTSNENWRKRIEKRKHRSESMEAQIQQSVEDLSKALKRSGMGGMKAFKELFDKIR